jgi:two-component system cell cycle sensor histidine kinase/response regulator CckA
MFPSALKKYLHLPHFFDEDKERTASFLRIFLFVILVTSVLIILIALSSNWSPMLLLVSAVFVLTLLSLTLLHFGHLKLASIITILYLTFGLSYSAYIGDGIHDIGVIAFPVIIIMASMLFGTKLFIVFSSLPILFLGIISLSRYYHNYPEAYENEYLVEFIVFSLILAVTAVGIRIITLYELKHLNKAKQEKLKYHHIFENIQDVYYEHTIEGKILEISPSVEVFSHYKRSDIIGKNVDEFFSYPNEAQKVLKLLMNQGLIANMETSLKDKQGSVIYVLVNAKLITDEWGRPEKMVGSMIDITHKKILEAQLRQVQKMDAIGRLAGGIAHDFNNILTVISGYNNLLKETLKNHPDSMEKLNEIQKASDRATSLIGQLLAFSRKQITKLELLDINLLITESVKMLRRLIGENIKIDLKLGEHLPNILADRNQIEQILVNLVLNARDAINDRRDEGVKKRITIETKRQYLDKKFVQMHLGCQTGERVMFAVSDNGKGMNREIISKIFEPFFTTKEVGKGTGLGLATIYGIVKQNKANIYVDSKPNQGSSFNIYWPLAAEKKIASKPDDSKILIPGHETILLVEDDNSVRKFICIALNNLGYQVHECSNGEEAQKYIMETHIHFDLLITDVVMPGMDGFALAKKVRETDPGIKVIFTTGYTDTGLLEEQPKEAAYELIPKPFSITDLSSVVRKVLGKEAAAVED